MRKRVQQQHDGVVVMELVVLQQGFAKHYDDMTEVDYGGGGHCTWLRDQ